ncbi:MAG TPA: AAA family ATPase [Candidatus Limnocylindria bacterium]|nr:AAA family ATPase [Candidatus Limnocylindria bacterium]
MSSLDTQGHERSRRVVSILFADLVGSTSLGEQLDPEILDGVLSRYADAARRAVEQHGGTVEKFIGDAVMAIFGVPRLHEDDALRAVRAAVDLRRTVATLSGELGTRLEVRIGVNTGEVLATGRAGERLVAGDAVNTAARLQGAAGPGEILLGSLTASLTRTAVITSETGPLPAKGKTEPLFAHRLVELTDSVDAIPRQFDTPLIGRSDELEAVERAWQAARAAGAVRLATIIGPPGIGKSRLMAEFVARHAGDATVLRGRCLSYGIGITYWPLREAFLSVAGVRGTDPKGVARDRLVGLVAGADDGELLATRLASVTGVSDQPAPVEELPWAVRKTLEHLAADRPLVLVIDDLQWAEPALLDLLENVADLAAAPILILSVARPELAEIRPEWQLRPDATIVRLEGLSPAETASLLGAHLGDAAVAVDMERMTEAAEGNPLFVEQLAASLREPDSEGGGRHQLLRVPPSLSALLAARLDQLPDLERRVVQRASIAGRTFWLRALQALSPPDDRPGVARGVPALVRRGFLRADRSEFPGQDAYRFRHLLLRDVAYDSVPRSDRAALHRSFAEWLEAAAGERADEYAQILAYHWERASEGRSSAAPRDDEPSAIDARRRAFAWLGVAVRSARRRGDGAAAIELLERMLGLVPLPAEEARRALPILVDCLIDAGRFQTARDWNARGADAAADAGDERLAAWCRLLGARIVKFTRREAGGHLPVEEMARLRSVFERHHDVLGLARLARARAGMAWELGRMREASAAYREATAHALAAGEEGEAAGYRALALEILAIGPTPASEVRRSVEEELARRPNPVTEAFLKVNLAGAEAALGRFDDARHHIHEARTTMRELGQGMWAEISGQLAALVEIQAGSLEAARQLLESSRQALSAMGERAYLSTTVALLANVLCDIGEHERALVLSRESEAASHAGDVYTEALWRIARGRALARDGAVDEARRLMAEAIERASETDMLELRGLILEAAADIAALVEGAGSEGRMLEQAAELYAEKENVVGRRRVEERLSRLTASGFS